MPATCHQDAVANRRLLVNITELIRTARAGTFGVVHLIVGEERFFIDRAVRALRQAAVGDGPSGFNDEILDGKNLATRRIVEAANTIPMMARARFILVRRVDDLAAAEIEPLVAYLNAPCDTTCVVLTADKIDGRSKLANAAKKKGYWTDAGALKPADIRGFITDEAKARGSKIDSQAAAALADALGTDLSAIDDALERLSLFVGAQGSIDAAAVEACVTRIRVDSIWSLVDAVGARDARKALTAASSLLADREPALRILAMVARQLRMVARMRHGLQSGLSPEDAARDAGAPPFKARDMAISAKRFSNPDLANAFAVLAETDLALKGSRVPSEITLEAALLRLCASR